MTHTRCRNPPRTLEFRPSSRSARHACMAAWIADRRGCWTVRRRHASNAAKGGSVAARVRGWTASVVDAVHAAPGDRLADVALVWVLALLVARALDAKALSRVARRPGRSHALRRRGATAHVETRCDAFVADESTVCRVHTLETRCARSRLLSRHRARTRRGNDRPTR